MGSRVGQGRTGPIAQTLQRDRTAHRRAAARIHQRHVRVFRQRGVVPGGGRSGRDGVRAGTRPRAPALAAIAQATSLNDGLVVLAAGLAVGTVVTAIDNVALGSENAFLAPRPLPRDAPGRILGGARAQAHAHDRARSAAARGHRQAAHTGNVPRGPSLSGRADAGLGAAPVLGPGTSPHLTQWARHVVGSTWTTSLRPQLVQKRGGSVARCRASHAE